MKKICLTFFILLTLTVSQKATAQVLEDIITHTWTGITEQPANFTTSGKAYLKQILHFTLNRSDYSITGTGVTTINLDDVIYTSHYTLTGWLYVDKNQIYYKSTVGTSDVLPNGLTWCNDWGYLTFYKNSNKSGYYLLKGNVDDSCGGSSEVELGDD